MRRIVGEYPNLTYFANSEGDVALHCELHGRLRRASVKLRATKAGHEQARGDVEGSNLWVSSVRAV